MDDLREMIREGRVEDLKNAIKEGRIKEKSLCVCVYGRSIDPRITECLVREGVKLRMRCEKCKENPGDTIYYLWTHIQKMAKDPKRKKKSLSE